MTRNFPLDQQMEAACTVHPYDASRVLGVFDNTRPGGVPSSESLRQHFSFSAGQLRSYILDTPLRAGDILNRALDNRAFPAPYVEDAEGGFNVGWYHGPPARRTDVYFHPNFEDAITDFVLAYWRMPRLHGAAAAGNEKSGDNTGLFGRIRAVFQRLVNRP